jgi:hypothetical protein
MQKLNSIRTLLVILAVLSLFVTASWFARFSFNHPSAQAQEEETIYLPLVLNRGFTLPVESIMILTPGNASTVTSPIHISGISDPTFEQNLVIRVINANGDVITEGSTTIQAGLGERGPYELDLELDLEEEQSIFIQVFDVSARDGGIIHLSSVAVFFSLTGPEDIIVRDLYPEQIVITQPQLGDTISGGTVHVEGIAIASFEQTLLVEVIDEDGDVIAIEPVMVDAPDFGVHGPYQVDIEYTVTGSAPGRIVVRDVSPAHGDNTHLNSVEVTLEP